MIYQPSQRLVMISIRSDVTAPADLDSPDSAAQARFVTELAAGLARFGQEVEVWTRQCGDGRETEVTDSGVRVRRFPCGDCGSVRELTPCEYIAEWVARAAESLAPLAGKDTVLVTHFWDAGIAGKVLATRFDLTHVHVTHQLAIEEYPTEPVDGPAARNLGRRAHEERDVCRTASKVIATTPRQRDLLGGSIYRVPAGKLAVLPRASDAPAFIEILSQTPASHARFDVPRIAVSPERRVNLRSYNDRPPGVEGRLAGAAWAENDSIL